MKDPIILPLPRVRCMGREGDFAHYLAAAIEQAEPYPVALDVVEHTSACECRAGFVGHHLCKHQRAAILDWYGRRARITVVEDSDDDLHQREEANRRDLAEYVTRGTQARRERRYTDAVKFDGFALRAQIMLDAIGDEMGNRLGFEAQQARAS